MKSVNPLQTIPENQNADLASIEETRTEEEEVGPSLTLEEHQYNLSPSKTVHPGIGKFLQDRSLRDRTRSAEVPSRQEEGEQDQSPEDAIKNTRRSRMSSNNPALDRPTTISKLTQPLPGGIGSSPTVSDSTIQKLKSKLDSPVPSVFPKLNLSKGENSKQEIGKGGFATTYKIELERNFVDEQDVGHGRVFAFKELLSTKDSGQKQKDLFDEYKHTMAVNHLPNTMKVYGLFEIDGKIGMLADFIPGNDLYSLALNIHLALEGQYLTPREAINFIKFSLSEILVGLTGLADETIAHLDLTLKNLRYDERTGKIKIIDFGLAEEHGGKRRSGTIGFFRMNEPITGKSDNYSAGQVFHTLLCGKRSFKIPGLHAAEGSDLYKNSHEIPFKIPLDEETSEQCKDLLNQMFSPSGKQFSAEKLLTLPFFKDMPSRAECQNIYERIKEVPEFENAENEIQEMTKATQLDYRREG